MLLRMDVENFEIESREAPLTEHLEEIRSRILVCGASFLGVFMLVYYRADALINWVLQPLHRFRPDLKLAALNVTEGFTTTLKLSAYVAAAIVFPVVIWQIWRFIEPGLLPRERFWARLLFIPMIISFALGCLFCYFVALPVGLRFLLENLGDQFVPIFSYAGYVDFAVLFMLATGVVFEMPLFMAVLDGIGILPVETIKGRRREAVVAAFIIGAIFSPPDVFSQFCVSIPLLFLLEFGIWFSLLLRKLKKMVK